MSIVCTLTPTAWQEGQNRQDDVSLDHIHFDEGHQHTITHRLSVSLTCEQIPRMNTPEAWRPKSGP